MKILEENMRKSLPYVSLLLFAVVIASGSASAQVQITLGNTISPNIVTFTNENISGLLPHRLTVSFNCSGTTCMITSPANSNLSVGGVPSGGNGAYSFTTTLAAAGQLPFLHDPVGGLFAYEPNGSTTAFTISGIGAVPSGGGSVSMSIHIQTVGDGTVTPRFNGTYTVTSVTGGSTLAQFFPVGQTNEFDFTVRTDGPFLTTLFGGSFGATASGPISSGEIVTPEPASIALFGSGLLLLGRVLRRRKTSAPAEPSEG